MAKVANSVGARGIVRMLLGEDRIIRWSRPVLRFWGFLFVGFVLLFVWLPGGEISAGSPVLHWAVCYTAYLLVLEVLGRKARRQYKSSPCRLLRVQFNLAMIAILMLVGPPAASGYLWFFFSMLNIFLAYAGLSD